MMIGQDESFARFLIPESLASHSEFCCFATVVVSDWCFGPGMGGCDGDKALVH
jgi:hypothetical protein